MLAGRAAAKMPDCHNVTTAVEKDGECLGREMVTAPLLHLPPQPGN